MEGKRGRGNRLCDEKEDLEWRLRGYGCRMAVFGRGEAGASGVGFPIREGEGEVLRPLA